MSVEKIDHIGIAVDSIEKWIGYYKDVLGLEHTTSVEIAEQNVRVAFLKIGESQIELLEPTSDDSPIAKFLENRGSGIHHIAVLVDDIDAALAEFNIRYNASKQRERGIMSNVLPRILLKLKRVVVKLPNYIKEA